MDDQHILDRYRVREGFEAWKKVEANLKLYKYTILDLDFVANHLAQEDMLIEVIDIGHA